jgi:hypothetical protein
MYFPDLAFVDSKELLSIVMVALWGTLSDKISTRPVSTYVNLSKSRLQQLATSLSVPRYSPLSILLEFTLTSSSSACSLPWAARHV